MVLLERAPFERVPRRELAHPRLQARFLDVAIGKGRALLAAQRLHVFEGFDVFGGEEGVAVSNHLRKVASCGGFRNHLSYQTSVKAFYSTPTGELLDAVPPDSLW